MNYRKPKQHKEARIVKYLTQLLRDKGWWVGKVHGSMYQIGWPDLFAGHYDFGTRWIEVKTPEGRLRPSQIQMFTEWSKYGIGVWVLTGFENKDYMELFERPNWWRWLK